MRRRDWLIILALISLLGYMFYNLIDSSLEPARVPEQKEFNKEIWDSDKTERRSMVDDLAENYFPGKTRTEIIDLLGDINMLVDTEHRIEYIVGFYMDEIGLSIYFDENLVYDYCRISLH